MQEWKRKRIEKKYQHSDKKTLDKLNLTFKKVGKRKEVKMTFHPSRVESNTHTVNEISQAILKGLGGKEGFCRKK